MYITVFIYSATVSAQGIPQHHVRIYISNLSKTGRAMRNNLGANSEKFAENVFHLFTKY